MSDTKSTNPGIYSITNTVNGKVYVGKAKSVRYRIDAHQRELPRNEHKNPFLQASWNEHGEAAFQFAVQEFCSLHILASREDFWINHFDSLKVSKGFNIGDTPPCFYSYFLVEEVMKSKGLNLEEFLKSNGQNRLDKVIRLELERELADRMSFLFRRPKPRSKAAVARQDAARLVSRLKAAGQKLEKVMSMDLEWLMDLNAFHGRIANGWRQQVKTGKPNARVGISGP
jgi:group I intron endonuclease